MVIVLILHDCWCRSFRVGRESMLADPIQSNLDVYNVDPIQSNPIHKYLVNRTRKLDASLTYSNADF